MAIRSAAEWTRIGNRTARRIFLHRHELADPPVGSGKGADLVDLIARLGFVQVDSVNTVARAHDLILFSRRPAYRPRNLQRLIEQDRALFEHWTHDAAVIPMAFFPHWRLRFVRDAARLRARYKDWHGQEFQLRFDAILDHIRLHGPACAADVCGEEPRKGTGWWDWQPSKTALEYLWRSGVLAVSARDSFRKRYDLAERVFGDAHSAAPPDADESIDWLCNAAIDRLGFASPGEIAAFWDIVSVTEAKSWCARALASGDLERIDLECADGSLRQSLARPGLADAQPPAPPGRLRVLSPFDPAIRDRNRTERLFGFHYRIEMFVPEAKRQYGYYVFPLLEGDRLIGRIDMRARRNDGILHVSALWPEHGVSFGSGRKARLESELSRICRLAAVDRVVFADGWLRQTR